MSKQDIDSFLYKIGQKHDITNIVITGGEPLLHKEIDGLLKLLSDKEYNVRLNTNGILLFEHIDSFFDLSRFKIQISLDGYDNESYRDIRGVDRFEDVIRNAYTLKRLGFNTVFRTTLTKKTILEYKRFIEISEKLDIPLVMKPMIELHDDNKQDFMMTKAEKLNPI